MLWSQKTRGGCGVTMAARGVAALMTDRGALQLLLAEKGLANFFSLLKSAKRKAGKGTDACFTAGANVSQTKVKPKKKEKQINK